MQVSSSGSAERGHKDMNFVRDKARNKMAPETMEKVVYVRHNLLQMERCQSGKANASDAVQWDTMDCLDDEELGWQDEDCWSEARTEEESAMSCLEREAMIERSENRSKTIQKKADKRLPAKKPTEEGEADAQNMAVQLQAASEGVAPAEVRSRSGRCVRAAPILDL